MTIAACPEEAACRPAIVKPGGASRSPAGGGGASGDGAPAVAILAIVLAAALAWLAPSAAQGQAQRGGVPPPGQAPLQTESGDIWAEVRAWQAPRPRPPSRPPSATPHPERSKAPATAGTRREAVARGDAPRRGRAAAAAR